MNPWLETLLDLVYPEPPLAEELAEVREPFCYVCGEPFSGELNEFSVCANCRGMEWFITTARAQYRAWGEVRERIHAFKYRQQYAQLGQLGSWLAEGYERFYHQAEEPFDALVPVPLYPLRRRERGFNQSEELARYLGKRVGLPVWQPLHRHKQTHSQARLRRKDRLRNQLRAYGLKGGFDVRGKRLLIIDDVFTTGATINACAKVLHEAGAARVAALTVARG